MATEIQDVISPQFAKLLLESLADGVFTLNDQGRITSWNPAMERISGYSAKEALGKFCTMLNFDRCMGRSCPTGVKECGIYEKGAVDGKECHIQHKDGHQVPVLKSARLVKHDTGKVLGIVESLTDLTELHDARRKMEEAGRKIGEIHSLDNIIGKSHAMQQVFYAIKAAAASNATVLIEGESGTGKELVAGAIHFNGVRFEKPLVTVNCSALSESLLESELFGHVKGAFTGALQNRRGRFEEADGGTIFLDEIGEISPLMQVKLLRVLQEREVERVGETRRRKVDIRVIAATNKHLFELVQKGEFREDLYYRLKVFPIKVPPLRGRKEDIPLLVAHFNGVQNQKTGKRIQGVTPPAMKMLMDHLWPGNVRELENAIEHAFVICAGDYIDVPDLPLELREPDAGHMPPLVSASQPATLAQPGRRPGPTRKLNREQLLELLEASGWNKAEVGRQLGISRTAVWYHMKKWDIPLQGFEV